MLSKAGMHFFVLGFVLAGCVGQASLYLVQGSVYRVHDLTTQITFLFSWRYGRLYATWYWYQGRFWFLEHLLLCLLLCWLTAAWAGEYLRTRDARKRKQWQKWVLLLVAMDVRDHVTQRIWLKDVWNYPSRRRRIESSHFVISSENLKHSTSYSSHPFSSHKISSFPTISPCHPSISIVTASLLVRTWRHEPLPVEVVRSSGLVGWFTSDRAGYPRDGIVGTTPHCKFFTWLRTSWKLMELKAKWKHSFFWQMSNILTTRISLCSILVERSNSGPWPRWSQLAWWWHVRKCCMQPSDEAGGFIKAPGGPPLFFRWFKSSRCLIMFLQCLSFFPEPSWSMTEIMGGHGWVRVSKKGWSRLASFHGFPWVAPWVASFRQAPHFGAHAGWPLASVKCCAPCREVVARELELRISSVWC